MSIEAMKQALEALEKLSMGGDPRWADDVMPSLRQAIEQAEKQEPVAFASHGVINWIADKQFQHEADLYTAPQPQQAEKQEPVAWQDTRKTWVDVPLKNVLKEKNA
jgi:hypothetical protein